MTTSADRAPEEATPVWRAPDSPFPGFLGRESAEYGRIDRVKRPDSPTRRSARAGRAMGIFWVVFWLIFLESTFADALRTDLLGTAFLLACAAAYAVGCYRAFHNLYAHESSRLPLVGAVLSALAEAGAVWRLGVPALDALPYVGVVWLCALGVPWGVLAVLAVMGAAAAWSAAAGTEVPSNIYASVTFASLATGLGFAASRRGVRAEAFREQAHELAIQDERNRMARDLHDILGHSLTVVSLKADLAGKLVDRDPEAAKREIAELQALARSALADVRATVNNYREISLSAELVRARTALDDAGIRAVLPTTIDEVDPQLRELFAWALREATTNVVRHSGASRCVVTLDRDRLSIADDGRGADGDSDGRGLEGLRDRARRAGCVVETGSGLASKSGDQHGFSLVIREDT